MIFQAAGAAADVEAAIVYVNSKFPTPGDPVASLSTLSDASETFITFVVLSSVFPDTSKDVLGHAVDLARRSYGDGYVRTCTELVEEYL